MTTTTSMINLAHTHAPSQRSTTTSTSPSLVHPHRRPRTRPRDASSPRSTPSTSSVEPILICVDEDDFLDTVSESELAPSSSPRGMKRRIWRSEIDQEGSYKEPRKRPRKRKELPQEQRSPSVAAEKEETVSGAANNSGLLTPPRSPPTPLVPSKASLPKGTSPARTSPSTASSQKPRCDHPRHPAYPGEWNGLLCPSCGLDYCIIGLQAASTYILKNGSANHWSETLTPPTSSGKPQRGGFEDWEASTTGGMKRNKTNIRRDQLGYDNSHRHCKKRLHTLLPKLEYLAKKESVWEDQALSDNGGHDELIDDFLAILRQHSATAALIKYKAAAATGSLTRVEEAGAIFGRTRGREWEIANDPNYPEDGCKSAAAHKSNRKTLAQVKFIHKSNIPQPTGAAAPYAQIDASRKRKPRNSDRKVSFNDEVKVCSTNDVDVLRKHGSVAATLQVPPFTSKTSYLYTEPKLEYVTHTIRSEDEPARGNGGYFRKGAHYEPGKWAPSEGSEPVNTSGSRVKYEDYDAWKCYVRSLQLEAQELDYGEQHVLDQEAFLVFLRVSKQI